MTWTANHKPDANQAAIVEGLRGAGCTVELIMSTSRRGGVPDLVVGRGGRNYLLEIKRPKEKGRSAGKLSDDQLAFMASWRGQMAVVTSLEEALKVVGLL